MSRVVVTGADGFIGRHLCDLLDTSGYETIRIVRSPRGLGRNRHVVPDIATAGNLESVLRGSLAVVHLAGRAHVTRELDSDPMLAFERANVAATVRLAKAAVSERVQRFIFVSSIGVHGSETTRTPLSESHQLAPVEPYAQSKMRAEHALCALSRESGLELVIVRPPLVYGPGARGNFARLLGLAASGLPLPLGSLGNRRHLVGVRNLATFLMLCLECASAAGEVFLIAEPEPRSTPELIAEMAKAMGVPNRLFRFPPALLRVLATLAGKRSDFEKLSSSLEISAEKAQRVLGWRPSISFEEEIAAAVAAFREETRR